MKPVRTLKNMSICYDEQNGILNTIWLSREPGITTDEIKEAITACADEAIQHKPIYCLADDSKRNFFYDIEIQAWVANTLAAAYVQVGLKKLAIIMPSDVIAELSTEQTAQEAADAPFEIKYFYEENEAKSWLLS